jgi:polar amino acid transport system permease protein
MDYIISIMPELLRAFTVTLELWIIAITLGIVFGLLLAVGQVYGNKPVSACCIAYSEFFRGTPLLVQLFLVYFGLPSLGIDLPSFPAAALTLTLNSSGYQAQYFRGAIQTVRGEQILAAESLGMNRLQILRKIVIPQAVRVVIAPWSNECIGILKFASLSFTIGVEELLGVSKMIGYRTFKIFPTFFAAAMIYLAAVTVVSFLLDYAEARLSIPGLKKGQLE